jgi:energy-coupling factor transport system substrate-specific component
MLSWGLAGASAGMLRVALERSRPLLVGFGFGWGLLFGAIMDVYQLASFGPVFTWQAFVVTHARGIPFDLVHAITNAVLLGVAGPALIRLLRRHDRRLHVELVPDPHPS